MFTLLAPREASKIYLIKICDNLQQLPEMEIRPFDKETYLILTKKRRCTANYCKMWYDKTYA